MMKELWLVFVLGSVGALQYNFPTNPFHPLNLIKGDFCNIDNPRCCFGREDECSLPLMGTRCYCDEFCMRGDDSDCCPDYKHVCLGVLPPPPPIDTECGGIGKLPYYSNCNKCKCEQYLPNYWRVVCEEKPCLINLETIDRVNRGNYGWRASNYSFFWGKTLEEGYQQRAGICKPDHQVLIQSSVQNSVRARAQLQEQFDSRRKWINLIRPISDQMDYPASWAISTVDVASDRLSIQSRNHFKTSEQINLSTQNLISCINPRKNFCATSTDRAWWYISAFGVVSESCYPYRSGYNGAKQQCEVERNIWSQTSRCSSGSENGEGMIYRTPPAYRINSREEDIMSEIEVNGPVQALIHVRDDFFSYKSGVYRHVASHSGNTHLNYNIHRYHAVRIIGWGVDRSAPARPQKYWLCANSWGQGWGENGYFRIARGVDESEIEMFVVGVWAKQNNKLANGYVYDKTVNGYVYSKPANGYEYNKPENVYEYKKPPEAYVYNKNYAYSKNYAYAQG